MNSGRGWEIPVEVDVTPNLDTGLQNARSTGDYFFTFMVKPNYGAVGAYLGGDNSTSAGSGWERGTPRDFHEGGACSLRRPRRPRATVTTCISTALSREKGIEHD